MTLDAVRFQFECQFGVGGELVGRGGVEEHAVRSAGDRPGLFAGCARGATDPASGKIT
ncbi:MULTISPECIES: hypothetical protein [Mesorhizobium]|uniref:hypothetical protein n=1 Tax=Mesorhizobium TaxID=68287 RepID=UPI0013DF7FB1|nr:MULTISPECIES: hypothetical protein [Mesorhizobium]